MNFIDSIAAALSKGQSTELDEDVQFPLNARKRRRLEVAGQLREQRKGRRAHVRRQLARQAYLADLTYQFAILDGDEPARPATVEAVWQSMVVKVEALRESGEARDLESGLSKLRGLVA